MTGSFNHVFDTSAQTAEANMDAALLCRAHTDIAGATIPVGRRCGVAGGTRDRKAGSTQFFDQLKWKGLGVTNVNQILLDSVEDQVRFAHCSGVRLCRHMILYHTWGWHARGRRLEFKRGNAD